MNSHLSGPYMMWCMTIWHMMWCMLWKPVMLLMIIDKKTGPDITATWWPSNDGASLHPFWSQVRIQPRILSPWTQKSTRLKSRYVWKVFFQTWNLNIPHWLFMSSNTQFLVIKVSPVTSENKMFADKTDTVTHYYNGLWKNKSAFNPCYNFW